MLCVTSGDSERTVREIQELMADTEWQQETQVHQIGHWGQEEIRRMLTFYSFFPKILTCNKKYKKYLFIFLLLNIIIINLIIDYYLLLSIISCNLCLKILVLIKLET